MVDEIEVYDIRRDDWSVVTKIPTPRYHSGVAMVQGKLYVMGGFHSDQQLFDRATGAIVTYPISISLENTINKALFYDYECNLIFNFNIRYS